MGQSVKYPVRASLPPALVEYHTDGQILLIENGQKSAAGEEISENIIIHYDKDNDDERSSAVAIRIDRAEYVLKPFVDAILAKYGVKREQRRRIISRRITNGTTPPSFPLKRARRRGRGKSHPADGGSEPAVVGGSNSVR